MTMLTLREAAAMIPGATVLGDERASFERVSTDSRSAGPGDLFVALKGERFDAHDFVGDVAARGASAAIVSRSPAEWNLPALKVADTRAALGALARLADALLDAARRGDGQQRQDDREGNDRVDLRGGRR